jgi:hypothetical protein
MADKDSKSQGAPAKADSGEPAHAEHNPYKSEDPNVPDGPEAELDPTKVVGDYAMQPDPNTERPAPLPNVPKGVKPAPADDEPDAGAIGDGDNLGGYDPAKSGGDASKK